MHNGCGLPGCIIRVKRVGSVGKVFAEQLPCAIPNIRGRCPCWIGDGLDPPIRIVRVVRHAAIRVGHGRAPSIGVIGVGNSLDQSSGWQGDSNLRWQIDFVVSVGQRHCRGVHLRQIACRIIRVGLIALREMCGAYLSGGIVLIGDDISCCIRALRRLARCVVLERGQIPQRILFTDQPIEIVIGILHGIVARIRHGEQIAQRIVSVLGHAAHLIGDAQ